MTEMLDSPLRLLSYLSLRDQFGNRLSMNHEHMLLSYHLRHNLWVAADVDLLALTDDISVGLDIAMSARRDGIPGTKTPDGILTRVEGTAFAKMIAEIDGHPEAVAIEVGLFLLELGEEAVGMLNEQLDGILRRTARDGMPHDLTMGFAATSSGLTIHCSRLGNSVAEARLQGHCERRKYSGKAKRWFGVALRPGGSIQLAIKLTEPWRFDRGMEARTASLSRVGQMNARVRGKIGRNQPCPCGSGKKYKRCCGTMT